MTTVTRLVTHVDVDGTHPDAHRMSVSARLEAVLADGRSLVLLDDRGWGASMGSGAGGPVDVWALTSVEEIETTARVVVGPDEPVEGETYAKTEADHWGFLADLLRRQGVAADPRELAGLPHDVVLSDRLRARVRRGC